jgi:hypothetical protein
VERRRLGRRRLGELVESLWTVVDLETTVFFFRSDSLDCEISLPL